MLIDLDHIDHTIRLIDPNADVSLGKPKQYPPRHAAFKTEMNRFVLGALRTATEPLTSLEIAKAVVIGRGLDVTDDRTVVLIRKRVGACLWRQKERGIVREVVNRPAWTTPHHHKDINNTTYSNIQRTFRCPSLV
jgi:hypothetical protein